MVLIGLWALYRKAHPLLPLRAHSQQTWCCRMCSRILRTKGALGAHFFKVHGRKARYRSCVTGTWCQACGRQYWTRNKLAIHLRDSPMCVQTLHGYGLATATPLSGLGSRQWRARAVEDYTLAVPEAQGTPLPPRPGDDWDTVCEDGYKEVCLALQQRGVPEEPSDILKFLQTILAKYPLYLNESAEVVERSAKEAKEIWDSGNNEFWTRKSFEAICIAADGFADAPWPVEAPENDVIARTVTLQEFSATVEKIDWEMISRILCNHETRDSVPVILPDAWEATWGRGSGTLDFVAVTQSYWPVLPPALQDAWELALSGQRPSISAPASFWRHPLSLPFRQWAMHSASN